MDSRRFVKCFVKLCVCLCVCLCARVWKSERRLRIGNESFPMKAIQRTPICLCQNFTLTFWGHRVPVLPSPFHCLLTFCARFFYISFLYFFFFLLLLLLLLLGLGFFSLISFYRFKISSAAHCYIYYYMVGEKSHERLGHGLELKNENSLSSSIRLLDVCVLCAAFHLQLDLVAISVRSPSLRISPFN